ncbi:MAG: ATP-binding protein [Burkholderiaceae bacterium]
MIIPRQAAATLQRLAKGFPIVALTGPRQSGKTTLAKALFADKPYVSLENPDAREFAVADPKRFLARFPQGVVIDEIQRVPALFSWLQGWVDERQVMGDVVVTGSAQFELFQHISQSLAGRVGRVELLPLAGRELSAAGRLPLDLDESLLSGGYPALYSRELHPADWFANYVNTYVERDVRQLLGIRDLNQFQRFLKLAAARSGQLLNLTALGADAGLSSTTARDWLSVLEASYVLLRVPPFFENFGKRLVKTPKLYFIDTGLMCWLLGIHSPAVLATHPLRGQIFETWIVGEFVKRAFNAGRPASLYFWRDNAGHEIDLLQEHAGRLDCYEIKSGSTFAADWFGALNKFAGFARRPMRRTVIYGGHEDSERAAGRVLGWRESLMVFDQ